MCAWVSCMCVCVVCICVSNVRVFGCMYVVFSDAFLCIVCRYVVYVSIYGMLSAYVVL